MRNYAFAKIESHFLCVFIWNTQNFLCLVYARKFQNKISKWQNFYFKNIFISGNGRIFANYSKLDFRFNPSFIFGQVVLILEPQQPPPPSILSFCISQGFLLVYLWRRNPGYALLKCVHDPAHRVLEVGVAGQPGDDRRGWGHVSGLKNTILFTLLYSIL